MDKEYFKIGKSNLKSIVDAGGVAEDIAVFMVISRFASANSDLPHCLSTAGHNILNKATGLSRSKLGDILTFLSSPGGCEVIDIIESESRSRSQARFKIKPFSPDDEVCLPNRLIDGYKSNYPLKKLMASISCPPKLSRIEAKKYCLLMLVFLYQELSYMPPRGMAPVSWYWDSNPIDDLYLRGYQLFRAENPQMVFNHAEFSGFSSMVKEQEMLSDVTHSCVNNLIKAGLFYEVHLVVDAQPGSRGLDYLYKLYMKNQYVREKYTYLSKTVNSLVLNSELNTDEKKDLVATLESRRDEYLFVGMRGCQLLTLLYPNNVLQQAEHTEEYTSLEYRTKLWEKDIKQMYFTFQPQ
jgi:hypothetical protein